MILRCIKYIKLLIFLQNGIVLAKMNLIFPSSPTPLKHKQTKNSDARVKRKAEMSILFAKIPTMKTSD